MITTIISGTNRLNSMSRKVAETYALLMQEQNYSFQIGIIYLKLKLSQVDI